MYILEEMWIPVGIIAIGRLWVPEIADRIYFLTADEGISCITKRGIVDLQLKREILGVSIYSTLFDTFFLTSTKPLCESAILTPVTGTNPWSFFFLWSAMAFTSFKTLSVVVICGMRRLRAALNNVALMISKKT